MVRLDHEARPESVDRKIISWTVSRISTSWAAPVSRMGFQLTSFRPVICLVVVIDIAEQKAWNRSCER